MKTFIAIALAAGMALAAPLAAQASTPSQSRSDLLILVSGGCGPGWHRGPGGRCRRDWVRPIVRFCPRGYHVGPGGRCRRNW